MKYNPDKPAYQTNWALPDCIAKTHPGLSIIEVKQKDPAVIIRQNELQRGANMMWWGMWAAIGCAVVHGIIKSSYPALRPFSKFLEWGIVGGVLAVIGGMLYKNVVEYEKIIILALAVGVGGYLLYRFRDWSISHIVKKPQPAQDQRAKDE
jgi:hypothetical protein